MDQLSKSLFKPVRTAEWAPGSGTLSDIQLTRAVFGNYISPIDLAEMVAAPKGCDVIVEARMAGKGNPTCVVVTATHRHTRFQMVRVFYRHKGLLLVYHAGFHRRAHPVGTGIRVLARAIHHYRKNGIQVVHTIAGRNPDRFGMWRNTDREPEDGYFIWPLYGFRIDFDWSIITRMPTKFGGVRNTHELYDQGKEAVDWWSREGEQRPALFDTNPTSKHSRRLENRLGSRGITVI